MTNGYSKALITYENFLSNKAQICLMSLTMEIIEICKIDVSRSNLETEDIQANTMVYYQAIVTIFQV